jgi:hypothetical protein
VVFAILPVLEFVVRAGNAGALFKRVGREFTALHSGDGGDLLEKLSFVKGAHSVPSVLVTKAKDGKP